MDEELNNLALEKINFGEKLLSETEKYRHLEGIQKLNRKINQEIKFLKKVYKNKGLKKEHLQCSNLTHFSALINVLKTLPDCLCVNKVFILDDRKIKVDIVCDNGLTWVKVIARNPRSLSQVCMGDASYGVRSIIDQAEEFVECSKLYPCLFQTPQVVFVFENGIGVNIAQKLEAMGITVKADRITDYDISVQETSDSENDENKTEKYEPSDLSTKNTAHITKVNLDVSAMLAYCSSVTNGSAHKYEFSVPVLSQQAAWERLRPQKPILDNFFKGKTLYCCETARNNFISILNTVGGPNEKVRGEELLRRLIVLPDDAKAEDTVGGEVNSEVFSNVQFSNSKRLAVGGKIKERSLIIFTFGDRIQAVTVTANDGFVRAAKQNGINFVVFVHESRALTELKEQTKAINKIE